MKEIRIGRKGHLTGNMVSGIPPRAELPERTIGVASTLIITRRKMQSQSEAAAPTSFSIVPVVPFGRLARFESIYRMRGSVRLFCKCGVDRSDISWKTLGLRTDDAFSNPILDWRITEPPLQTGLMERSLWATRFCCAVVGRETVLFRTHRVRRAPSPRRKLLLSVDAIGGEGWGEGQRR